MAQKTLVDKVRAYCLKHHLFEPGIVVVGVSGGADSLTLLHLLIHLKDDFGMIPHVATLDHGIRGSDSAEDVAFVQEIAQKWGVDCTAGRVDVPAIAASQKIGIEAAARQARYDFFRRVGAELKTQRVVVGHNQDDQAETVLMHLIRGSGLQGLRGISPLSMMQIADESLIIVRPLLDISRDEIDAYLKELGIQPRQDQTNTDVAYTRNRLRHEVIPLLAAINPQIRAALARTAETVSDDYETLLKSLPPLTRRGPSQFVDRPTFETLSLSQQRLLIRRAVQQISPELELSFDRVEEALDLLNHLNGKMRLGGQIWLYASAGIVKFDDESRYPQFFPSMLPDSTLTIQEAGLHNLPGNEWKLEVTRLHELPEAFMMGRSRIYANGLAAVITFPENAMIEVRTRRGGDRSRVAGGHLQKLSDTLIDMKTPATWRDKIPLIVINGEIAAFVAPMFIDWQMRVSDTFQPYDSNNPIWQFTFRRD